MQVRNKYDGSTGRFVLDDARQVQAALTMNLVPLNENENGILPSASCHLSICEI